MVNVDELLHKWLTHQNQQNEDVGARKRSVVGRQRSVLNRSMTTSTSRRTKSYARGTGRVLFLFLSLLSVGPILTDFENRVDQCKHVVTAMANLSKTA